ncbi:hypothetical protein D3C80_1673980 [compost metagenome]
MRDKLAVDQNRKSFCFIQHGVDVLRLGQIQLLAAAWRQAERLAFRQFFHLQGAVLALNFTGQQGVADFGVVDHHFEITGIRQNHRPLTINAAFQQGRGGFDRLRFAKQRNGAGQTVIADIHD